MTYEEQDTPTMTPASEQNGNLLNRVSTHNYTMNNLKFSLIVNKKTFIFNVSKNVVLFRMKHERGCLAITRFQVFRMEFHSKSNEQYHEPKKSPEKVHFAKILKKKKKKHSQNIYPEKIFSMLVKKMPKNALNIAVPTTQPIMFSVPSTMLWLWFLNVKNLL